MDIYESLKEFDKRLTAIESTMQSWRYEFINRIYCENKKLSDCLAKMEDAVKGIMNKKYECPWKDCLIHHPKPTCKTCWDRKQIVQYTTPCGGSTVPCPDCQPKCKTCLDTKKIKKYEGDEFYYHPCHDCVQHYQSLKPLKSGFAIEVAPKTSCACKVPDVDHNDVSRFHGSKCTQCGMRIDMYRVSDPQPERTLEDKLYEAWKERGANSKQDAQIAEEHYRPLMIQQWGDGNRHGYKLATKELRKKFNDKAKEYCGEYIDNYKVVAFLHRELFNG